MDNNYNREINNYNKSHDRRYLYIRQFMQLRFNLIGNNITKLNILLYNNKTSECHIS